MKRIFIDANKCSGCKNCAVACMRAHNKEETFNPSSPNLEARNKILLDAKKGYKPLFCRHCSNPRCAEACMSGALVKDATTGHVIHDPEQCAKCFMCIMSCPFGVLKPDKSNTCVVKCDFCKDAGGEPNCVKQCPKKAIHVEEVTG